jgi:hypothetical protein
LKRFFDSSVLVPVFYADHPQHASCTELFLAAGKDDFCALHTLGEVYATLTGLPLRPRITGSEGIIIVKWGFRTMPISVPGHADRRFRGDRDHDSGMMAITRSGMIPIS